MNKTTALKLGEKIVVTFYWRYILNETDKKLVAKYADHFEFGSELSNDEIKELRNLFVEPQRNLMGIDIIHKTKQGKQFTSLSYSDLNEINKHIKHHSKKKFIKIKSLFS